MFKILNKNECFFVLRPGVKLKTMVSCTKSRKSPHHIECETCELVKRSSSFSKAP